MCTYIGYFQALIHSPGTKDVGLDVIEKLLEGRDSAFLGYLEERTRMGAVSFLCFSFFIFCSL